MRAGSARNDAQSTFETGRQLLASRDPAAALACFHHAGAMGFDPDQCSAQRWFCHMLLGQFESAWQESDAIAARGGPDPHAWWHGKPIEGGVVMIRCLHGLGDAIQYIRFARHLRSRVSRIVVSAPPAMVSLLAAAQGVDRVVAWESEEPPFDHHVEVVELPRIFRATPENLPAEVPYFNLPPPPRRSAGNLRVGLCWRSSEWDPGRSVPLHEMARLRSIPGVEFGTLQFGEPAIGARLADPAKPVLNTALAIQSLDLVITVDTMVAHLAGALAKPVWIMLPFTADWRWMLHRDTSPWYPTARLFRQRTPGDWADVLTRVCAALRDRAVLPSKSE